jgi:hypothetical protein
MSNFLDSLLLNQVATELSLRGSMDPIPDLITYSMAQQPLKSLDRPLMRVSLSDSIFSYTYFLLEI